MAFNTDMAQSKHSAELDRERDSLNHNPEDYEKIILKVKHVLHFSKDSGFFVFEGEIPDGSYAPRITINGSRIITNKYLVQGVSLSFGEGSRVGHSIECTGNWVEHKQYGVQFHAAYINEQLPKSISALKLYLSSGRVKHIGKTTAEAIIEKWGEQTFHILEKDYKKLALISGISEKKAAEINKDWLSKSIVYDIVSYLGVHGIGEAAAIKVFEFFNEKGLPPIAEIEKNPYTLTQIEGVGFKTADKLALSLGIPFDAEMRLKASLLYELNEKVKREGNMAFPAKDWIENSAKELSLPVAQIFKVCKFLTEKKEVVIRKLPVKRTISQGFGRATKVFESVEECVSPKWAAFTELNTAKSFRRLMDTKPSVSSQDKELILKEIYSSRRKLDKSQQEAAWIALTSPFSIITGGPGTGKTTTLRSIVNIANMLNWNVVLAAPTGKAAKRMESAIGKESMTIHRRLKMIPGMGFQFNENNKMEGDLFIIDETSMVDASLLYSWISAIPDGARLLFVGDSDQLSSVGSGDVLRDFIDSNVISVSRLKFIHRTGVNSQIPYNAGLVNAGKAPSFEGNVWTDDYAFIEARNNEEILKNMIEVITGLIANGTPRKDIQILCPQKNGDAGTDNLNLLLRWKLNEHANYNDYDDELNPVPPVIEGDRLMQTKNDYEEELFNGDIGYVKDLDLSTENFLFETEDFREIPLLLKNTKDMLLAYAITIHKSQGSENPIIIIPISENHSFTLNKNLLYTGITRGKQKVILIGNKATTIKAVQKQDQNFRITGFVRELQRCCPQINAENVIHLPVNPEHEKRNKENFNWDEQDDEVFLDGFKN